MKKLIKISVAIIAIGIVVQTAVHAFNFNSEKLSFSANKSNDVVDTFNEDYKLTRSLSAVDSDYEEKMKQLVKRTTSLLIGGFDNTDESADDFYKRKQEFYTLGAYNYMKTDKNEILGYDTSTPNYNFAIASTLAIPQLFRKLNDIGIIYNSYGNIRVSSDQDGLVITSITLPNIKIKVEDEENPKQYNYETTNITIHYFYVMLEGEYRVANIFAETKDELDEYFEQVEDAENDGSKNLVASYSGSLKSAYDYSKLEKMTDAELENIRSSNEKNIVTFNAFYNNMVTNSANGFFITDGLVVTTWEFIEKALTNAQYIVANGIDGSNYAIDGIVIANPETNLVVIKMKEQYGTQVVLGDASKAKTEDPAIILSSKSGVGLIAQTGIVASNDRYIESTIPLTESDEGSPLFNQSGEVIGLNTAKSINTSISMAVSADVLKEIQDKFAKMNFSKIETVSFEDLKSQFYYLNKNAENKKNSIPEGTWNKIKTIGDIENTINLNLIKASYKNNVASLRYINSVSSLISGIQLTSAFREQLVADGYSEQFSSQTKYIYESSKYRVVIMDEFDYVIILMVKL